MLDDFAYYVFHRTAHRVRWFWASHVNHHSSQHYNLSTALRQTWTGFIAGSFAFRLPLMLIGFHPAMVFFVGGLNLIYQFWIHTEAIGPPSALVRGGDEYAESPPGPSCDQPRAISTRTMRGLHHLGPDVRKLYARSR
ncbi:MAG: sterol desaturase family protein [Sphingomonadales bacterium]|nr:sterol desaturase family protein [Sphingomonadales bacterium]